MRVEIQGEAIALVNSGGKIFAMEGTCPHADWHAFCSMTLRVVKTGETR